MAGRILPEEQYEGVSVQVPGIPIYDINGTVLLHRARLERSGVSVGYVDIANHPAMGAPLVAIGRSTGWSALELITAAREVAFQRHGITANLPTRIVAYSFPKLAIQFLADDREVLMLEVGSWEPVPVVEKDQGLEASPSSLLRLSWFDQVEGDARGTRELRFKEILGKIGYVGEKISEAYRYLLSVGAWAESLPPVAHGEGRDLRFSSRDTDHSVCFELRGQETRLWCVAASTQMVLDFYRYEYSQARVAERLGLGTAALPLDLPYSRDADVVPAIQDLTGRALIASMVDAPPFETYIDEIDSNRPLISFIPRHCRTVVGYDTAGNADPGLSYRQLHVYDPYPAKSGQITWENFEVMPYRKAFTASVQQI